MSYWEGVDPCGDKNCLICPSDHKDHVYAIGCKTCIYEEMTPERRLELAFRQETCRAVRERHEQRLKDIQEEKRRKQEENQRQLLNDLNNWTPTDEQYQQMLGVQHEVTVEEDLQHYEDLFPGPGPSLTNQRYTFFGTLWIAELLSKMISFV